MKTHPDSTNVGIEVIHGGSPIAALGLAEIAPIILKDTIVNGAVDDLGDERDKKNDDE